MGKKVIQRIGLASVLILCAIAIGYLQRASAASQVTVLTYQLDFTNTTDQSALNVDIKNPIPTGTAFYPGSLVVDGVAQTDANDGDHAYFDASTGEAHYTWDQVPANVSHKMELGVYLLPGVTYEQINNKAYLPPPDNGDPATPTVIIHETSVCGNGKVEIVRDAEGNAVMSQGKAVWEICDDGTNNGTGYGWCKADCTGVYLPASNLCGNGKLDSWTNLKTDAKYKEICDDGASNGDPGKCNTTCSGILAIKTQVQEPEPSQQPSQAPNTAIGGLTGVASPVTASGTPISPTATFATAEPSGSAGEGTEAGETSGPTALLPDQARELTGKVLGTFTEATQAAARIIAEPTVQNTAAPALGVVAVANVATIAGYASFFNYLFYIFTQPLSLLWRRKKEKFGIVYDSLTKLPLDLAAVRLKDQGGRIVQTKVTDRQGRYNFLAGKGQYVLDISKQGYVFPSKFLSGWQQDVDYLDLQTDSKLALAVDGAITSNIPVDPAAKEQTPREIKRKAMLRKLQGAASILTTLLAIAAVALVPSPQYLALALFQILVYVIFRRLSYHRRPASFGAIKDAKSGQPIKNAVVRIMDAQFNRVLETQLTDSRGRYAFLVGKGKFFITVTVNGYEMFKSGILDYTAGKGSAVVDQGVKLTALAVAKK